MSHEPASGASDRPVMLAIFAVLVLYGVSAAMGLPQRATELITSHAHEHEAHGEEHSDHLHDAPGDESTPTGDAAEHGQAADDLPVPPVYTIVPFVLLLGAIAVLPLSQHTMHWWESNLHRFYVAAGLGLVTLAYYAFFYGQAVESHFLSHEFVQPTSGGASWQVAWTVLENAIFTEYIPFIMLLFSLYTISGGIRISGDLAAHPLTNSAFIAVGGLLASFVGTTGAAMLLIRPLLETNAERKHVKHTVIFFIFVVCNCGGCLLPIGDPPLFLGYLQGVDFLWTFSLWKEWLFVNGLLLVVYYLWDHFWCYPHETKTDIRKDERQVRGLRFGGLWPNALLLVGVVLSVALLDPSKPVPGTDWHAWLYLREIVQLALVGCSLLLGSSAVRVANRFNYVAIIEVAALFLGIFICMQPALQILNVRGDELGIRTSQQFFWATGWLSSALDNAPTYLVFFQTAKALPAGDVPLMAGVPIDLLTAISLGAVFMGSMTYIGNGPNFMVKSIAENAGVPMPSFFGYMLYSIGVLLPILVAMVLLFV